MKNNNNKARNWSSLFTSQLLGVFNDHLLKFLVIFICGNIYPDQRALLTSVATALLVFPYIFLSPYAGKLAIVKYKSSILVFLKLMEIPIMLIAVLGFYISNIYLLLFSVFLMGLQSCIYSPSKYGLIRDIDGTKGISFGTGMMEMLTFTGVLLGTFLASRLDGENYNSWIILISIAVIGWVAAKRLKAKETKPEQNFSGTVNPLKFLKTNYKYAKSIHGVNLTVIGLSAFWIVASLVQMVLIDYVPSILSESNYLLSDIMANTAQSTQYVTPFLSSAIDISNREYINTISNIDKHTIGYVMTFAAVGIGSGCAFSGIIGGEKVNYSFITYGGIFMSLSLTLLYYLEPSILTTIVCVFFIAFFSGAYKVPLNAYHQENVKGRKLGDIIAYNNLITFLFIIFASAINALVTIYFSSKAVILVAAIIGWSMTIILTLKLRILIPTIITHFFYIVSMFIYKTKVYGRKNIPIRDGALLISNHISIFDSFIIVRPLRRPLVFVIENVFFKNFFLGIFFRTLNMVPVSSKWRHKALENFYSSCQERVNNNNILCIFPEGQISRIGNLGEFKKGFTQIAKGINTPIIPMYIDNAIGTPLSHVACTDCLKKFKIQSIQHPVRIKVGKPIPANTTAFSTRQIVQELGADIFNERVAKKDNITKIFNKHIDTIITNTEQRSRIINLSNYIVSVEQNYIGIDCNDKTNSLIANLACILAGSTSVNISNQTSDKKADLSSKYNLTCTITDNNIESYNNPTKEHFKIRKFNKTDIITICVSVSGKPLEISHEAVISNSKAIHQQFNFKDESFYQSEVINDEITWFFNIGLPITYQLNINTNEELKSSCTFSRSIPIENNYKYIITDRHLDCENSYTLLSSGEFFNIISINAPNYTGFDTMKHKIVQIASKEGSVGRALPNIAIKLTDINGIEITKENISGRMSLKSTMYNNSKWWRTEIYGYICQKGFLYITKEN